jgi:phosphoribosyl 1,2-cyclic phosphodiesterase
VKRLPPFWGSFFVFSYAPRSTVGLSLPPSPELQRMALFIASLNSGSNGNCYYVGNETEAVFIDAGLSCRETERRMRTLGLDMGKVKAIFISHEHADHISGLPSLSKKWGLQVYITAATHHRSRLPLLPELTHSFRPNEAVQVGALSIMPFHKYHDGCDPHSFTVSGNGVQIGVFTDIGKPCDNLLRHFKYCHAAFLEANYDEQMLDQGRYPLHLKNRIRNGHGHLSNRQALDVFVGNKPHFMSHILLAHLSKENNHPALVESLFKQHAGATEVIVASRYVPSAVYTILPSGPMLEKLPSRPAAPAVGEVQLALF